MERVDQLFLEQGHSSRLGLKKGHSIRDTIKIGGGRAYILKPIAHLRFTY